MKPVIELTNTDLQNRLNLIIQQVTQFWNQKLYPHFTDHGPAHSERLLNQKIAQLAQALPIEHRLSEIEIFIISAAAWLYEIGMQSPNPQTILDFRYDPRHLPTSLQLQQIRKQKHLLTYQLIIDSVRSDYDGPPFLLGLPSLDDYTRAIAEVCRCCSPAPIEDIPETLHVNGVIIHLRLLVALLRMADQLYIDGSRVNLDILQATNLPLHEKARWWAYHYTLTPPLEHFTIRFSYLIPQIHTQFIGRIRALIEPDFEYKNNPIIRYLWHKYSLYLVPQRTPTIKYDQVAGFRHELSHEIQHYLRQQVVPIPDKLGSKSPIENQQRHAANNCLLVLNFQNFVLQLGEEGLFPTSDELRHLILRLLEEASNLQLGPLECLALGPWERPDLASSAQMLENLTFKLQLVSSQSSSIASSSSTSLQRAISQLLQEHSTSGQVLLIAPHEDCAHFVKQAREQKQPINAWIADLPDAYIYRAIVPHKLLTQVLNLPTIARPDATQQRLARVACILHLDELIAQSWQNGIPLQALSAILEAIPALQKQSFWWRLWLLHEHILVLDHHNRARLDGSHALVAEILTTRAAVITALHSLEEQAQAQPIREAHNSSTLGLPQQTLVNDLQYIAIFQQNENLIVQFLNLLKEEGVVHSDPPNNLWHLNYAHRLVIALSTKQYLPLLALEVDHFLVREGFPFIYAHTLKSRLTAYIATSTAEAIYQLGLREGWLKSYESHTNPGLGHLNEPLLEVWLADQHPGLRETLLNRDLLLHTIYHRAPATGLQQNTLWTLMRQNQRVTLSKETMIRWLSIFQRESLITTQPDPATPGQTHLKLNKESPLVQRLFGRFNVYGLIQTLRILHATLSADRARPTTEVRERLTKYITHGNRQLAHWTLLYAHSIKLIEVIQQTNPDDTRHEALFLRKSMLVSNLDQRDHHMSHALAELVRRLSRRSHDGRVSLPEVIREMEKDQQFGWSYAEFDYWINQAIHRHRLLIKQSEYPTNRPILRYLKLASSS